jgi:hydrogenase nickel incorporation protein HypB
MTVEPGLSDAGWVPLDRPQSAGNRHFVVQLCGSPGSGKTSLLERTCRALRGRARTAVIVAHHAADRNARRLRDCETQVLASPRIGEAIRSIDAQDLDIVFIETPADEPVDLGTGARVAIFSVTGGDDKAIEFPLRVERSDLVLLNKVDLLHMVKFDLRQFRSDVALLNPRVKLFEISSREGSGLEVWIRWLLDRLHELRNNQPTTPSRPEWWFG